MDITGGSMLFERTPLAKEILNKENHEKFDQLSDQHKQLVKTLINTGSLDLAAARSKMNEISSLPKESVQLMLSRYGMGLDHLMNFLFTCLEAKKTKIMPDRTIQEEIDLKLRFEVLKFIMSLHQGTQDKDTIDLFENTP